MRVLWFCILAIQHAFVSAEGSGNFFPLGSPSCSSKSTEASGECRANLISADVVAGKPSQFSGTVFYVYAQAGEVILMGSTAQGTASRANILLFAPGQISSLKSAEYALLGKFALSCNSQLPAGKISSRKQELAGALPASGGYPPCAFAVTTTGIYNVLFFGPGSATSHLDIGLDVKLVSDKNFNTDQGFSIAAWDIGVRSSLAAVSDIPGRVFTYNLALNAHGHRHPVSGTCFVATPDGYRYKVQYRHVQTGLFVIRGGQLGRLDGIAPLYHDFTPGASLPEFPFFFNPPDNATLFALNYSLTPLSPSLSNVRYSGSMSQPSSLRSEGTFEFTISSPAVYEIVIYPSATASPVYTDALNRVLRGYAEVGATKVFWDGRNNMGDSLNMTTSNAPHFEIRLHYGEFHLAMIDWEMCWYGSPILTLLNAPCPAHTGGCHGAFYDDRGYYLFSKNITIGDLNGTMCGIPMRGVPNPLFSDPKYGFDSTTNQRKWGVPREPSAGSITPSPCKPGSDFFGDSIEMSYWTFSPGPMQSFRFDIKSGVSGHVWVDDASGVQSLEVGLSKFEVVAFDGVVVYRNLTDQFGNYFFTLPPAIWSVKVIAPLGYVCTPDLIVRVSTLSAGESYLAEPIGCFGTPISPTPQSSSPDAPTSVEVSYRGVPLNITLRGVEIFVPNDEAWGSRGVVRVVLTLSPNATISTMVSIEFLGEDGIPKNISKLMTPIRIKIPLGSVTSLVACSEGTRVHVSPVCHWRDGSGQWRTNGCTTRLSLTHIECNCTHLTDFAAIIPPHTFMPRRQSISLNAANIAANPAGLLTILILNIVFGIVLVIAFRMDASQRIQELGEQEGEVEALRPSFRERYVTMLRSHHSLGCIGRKPGVTGRCVDRVYVTMLMVFTLLAVSAMFHGPHHAYAGRVRAIAHSGLLGAVVVLACTYPLMHGERKFKSPFMARLTRFLSRIRWLWYCIILLIVAVLTWYILAEALMFDQNPAYYCQGDTIAQWLVDVVLEYLFVVLLVEPLTVLLIVKVAMLCNKRRSRVRVSEDPGVALVSRAPSRRSSRASDSNESVPLEAEQSLTVHCCNSFADLVFVEFSEIEIIGPLGQGVSGVVEQCIWRGADCAIKRLLNPAASVEFQHEVAIHRHLRPFKHQCVVNCLGFTQNPPGMLLELYPLRSVQDYVITAGNLRDPSDLCSLLTVMISASAGILHLHANGVIHRDIAARNFLIKHDLTTAVCDMGLALLLQPWVKEGYRTPLDNRQGERLPLNTSAPESLLKGAYSVKSDVYMFGIFLWELLARTPPFLEDPNLSGESRNAESFAARIQAGMQLNVPLDWPQPLRELMQSCWAVDPSLRPSMASVNRALRDFRKLAELQKDLVVPVAPSAIASLSCYQRLLKLGVCAKVNSAETLTSTSFDMYERLPGTACAIDASKPLRLFTSSGPHTAAGPLTRGKLT